MKVLFAIASESLSKNITESYYNKYGETLEYKNVFYFKALVDEVKRDKTYNVIVIHEDMEQFKARDIDQLDAKLFSYVDSITDEVQDAEIIYICSDRRTKDDKFIVRLYSIGIYNILIGEDRKVDNLCEAIKRPKTKKEAKEYLDIDSGSINETGIIRDDEVDEMQMMNILNFYDRIREEPEKYVPTFDQIASQYSRAQLKVIASWLPKDIQEVIYNDPKYKFLLLSSNNQENKKENETKNVPNVKKIERKHSQNFFGVFKKMINKEPKNPQSEQNVKNDNSDEEIRRRQAELSKKEEMLRTQAESTRKASEEAEAQRQRLEEQARKEEEARRQQELARQAQIEEAKRQQELAEKARKEAEARRQQELAEKNKKEEEARKQQELAERARREAEDRQKALQSNNDIVDSAVENTVPVKENDSSDMQVEKIVTETTKQRQNVEQTAKKDDIVVDNLVSTSNNTQKSNAIEQRIKEQQDAEIARREAILKVQREQDENKKNGQAEVSKAVSKPVETVVQNKVENNVQDRSNAVDLAEQKRIKEERERLAIEQEKIRRAQAEIEAEKQRLKEEQERLANERKQGIGMPVPTERNIYEATQVVSYAQKKLVVFVGANKAGTTFMTNAVANALADQKVLTAILDMTRDKSMYYIYNQSDKTLRKMASECMQCMSQGEDKYLPISKYLKVYTTVPGTMSDVRRSYKHKAILDTAKNNNNVTIVDADFTTPIDYFEYASDIFIVQDMDILKMQETTLFLREMKNRNIDMSKIRVIINKYTKCILTPKRIIEGLSYFKDPEMTFTDTLLNNKIKYSVIPYNLNNYVKYTESLAKGTMSFKGYSADFLEAINEVVEQVYPRNPVKKGRGGFFG
jgi:hypothetical protein